MSDIPRDAWAVRQERWDASRGELLIGPWHQTKVWLRRNGLVSGIITTCNRVYLPGDVKLASDLVGLGPFDGTCKGCWAYGTVEDTYAESD